MAEGDSWDESTPTDANLAVSIDNYNRELRKGVRGRMAHEHVWADSQSATSEAGQHKFLTLRMQDSAVAIAGSQVGAVYLTSSGSGSYIMAINTATQEVNLSKRLYYWFMGGDIATGSNASAELVLISDGRVSLANAICSTTASGGDGIQIDVIYEGTSIWTATSSQLILAPGSTSTAVSSFVQTVMTAGGSLTIDVDKVGTGTAGGNVTVMLEVG